MNETLENAVEFLQGRGVQKLTGCISTGSGQALPLTKSSISLEIPYDDIPGMTRPGIHGHTGLFQIISGESGDWALWTGRSHHYQGYSFDEIGFYISVSHELGAKIFVCINAAGGLDPTLEIGDLVAIEKFRCFIKIPGLEKSIDGAPIRETSQILTQNLIKTSEKLGIEIKKGNYAGVPGPTYETAAEVHWLRKLDSHVVGMSTVSELIYGQQLGMDVATLSAVANVHGKTTSLSHTGVVISAESSVEKIAEIISEFLAIKFSQ